CYFAAILVGKVRALGRLFMVKRSKTANKYAIKRETPKMSNFTLANRWSLVIQFGVILFEASVYAEHHDAEMVKLVDTLA
ncbi:hypothetical protein, partial [Vibrio parahaemolyticus]|uniref:hypothetical protein n=1 Tax=Vibrio parahaemolyticus TaxID=670 RepID=UPI001E6021BA